MEPPRAINSGLRRMGLTEYESNAYMALLTRGELTADGISSAAGIPITRVYGTIDQLVMKGFAKIVQGRPKTFLAVPPKLAKRDYLNHLRRNFETEVNTIDQTMIKLEAEIEPSYIQSHMEVKAEELLEPLGDLRTMEMETGNFIENAEKEILISTALFSWLPKVKANLTDALKRGVRVRILMQLAESWMGRYLARLNAHGADIRDTRDRWYPVRGTLVDDRDLTFLIWAAEESERYWRPIVYTPHHTRNPGLIRLFHESFDFRWNNARRTRLRG